jgi:hypothetical protein
MNKIILEILWEKFNPHHIANQILFINYWKLTASKVFF